jgi:hypothetical protein
VRIVDIDTFSYRPQGMCRQRQRGRYLHLPRWSAL